MPEQFLHPSKPSIDLAWEAANASNRAFDAMNEAESRIKTLDEVASFAVAGVTIGNEAYSSLMQESDAACDEYARLQDMAGVVMGQPADADPQKSIWSAKVVEVVEAEPVVVPEIDAETAAKLESLHPDYRDRVTTRYAEKYAAVGSYISQGKLPEAYRLPELGVLVDRVIAVAPSFEYMRDKDWQPEVEFVPQGLSREQWDGLFKGQKLPNGVLMEGTWTGFSNKTIDLTYTGVDSSLWDVAVISSTDRPALTNISKDGKNGSNAKKAVKALSAMLPDPVVKTSPAEVVAQASPREDVYNAMQLSRLERGLKPVDSETWTISKENVEVDGVLRSVFQYFFPDSRQVSSDWDRLDGARDYVGVRPSASGEDLIPQA